MKNVKYLLILLTCLTVLNNPLLAKKNTDEEKAIIIGHTLSSMMMTINELELENFCIFRNTVVDVNLNDSQKYNAMNVNTDLQNLRTTFLSAGDDFENNYLEGMFDENNPLWITVRNTCLLDLGYELGDWDYRPNIDPCADYKRKTDANLKKFGICVAAVSYGCIGATFGYGACWLIGAGACALTSDIDQREINHDYPNCVGTYSSAYIWKSWLIPSMLDPGNSCSSE